MDKKGKKLTNYEIDILKKIVDDRIDAINYHNPKEKLEEAVKGKSRSEILSGLKSLENLGVLSLSFKSVLFVNTSLYKVNLYKAEEAYYHYLNQRSEELIAQTRK